MWRDDADDGETACHLSVFVDGGGGGGRVGMRYVVAVGEDAEGIASCGGAATMCECAALGHGRRRSLLLLLFVV